MKKSRIIIIAAALVLALIAASTLYYSTPVRYFDSQSDIVINRVLHHPGGDKSDITGSVDLDALEDCLRGLEFQRQRSSFAPYPISDVTYEISGIYEEQPFYLILGSGKLNLVYVSSDKGGHRIIDSGKLWNLLNAA